MLARKAAAPAVVIDISACPEPWSRPGNSAWTVSTLAIQMPEKAIPDAILEMMITVGDGATTQAAIDTANNSEEAPKVARSPTRPARRPAAGIATTSAVAAIADENATSGAPPPSPMMCRGRKVSPANTPTWVTAMAASARGSLGWTWSASRMAPPRRLAVSCARPRSGSRPARTAIDMAMPTKRKPAGP